MKTTTMYFVENDDLCDDWGAFDTRKEAEEFVQACCKELADGCFADPVGSMFEGWPHFKIQRHFYLANVDSIEKRQVKINPTATQEATQ